ncbi:inositol monophosphatase family protein [Streptomyces sp. 6N223]|uniref:inositol monophosphatase family protein n=1 Tax=Streptomyces sp. 6N223 TaxID=3457412 RepID=UPI003FD26424
MAYDTAELVEVARACCDQAAALLRRRAAEGPAVRSKSAHERVTDADIEAETLLRKTLRAAVPDSAVVGEELPDEPGQEVTWYVDPVDGTHNFLRGLPLACVSVGVAVGGRLVGGCVHDVFRDESFTGGEGVPLRIDGVRPAAASPGPADAQVTPLLLSDIPLTGRAGPEEPAFSLELMARADLRRLYSTALALAWVAAGRADLACNLHIHPWDVAGGAALVRAAGGRYTPIGGPDPAAAPGFVASRPGLDALDGGALERWIAERLTALAP